METRSDEAPLQRGSLPKRTPQQDFYFEANTGYVDHVSYHQWWLDHSHLLTFICLRDGMALWWIVLDRLPVVLVL